VTVQAKKDTIHSKAELMYTKRNTVNANFGYKKIIVHNISYEVDYELLKTALPLDVWRNFITCLAWQYPNETIVVKFIMLGGRRISEVLNLTISQINFETGTVTYNDHLEKCTIAIPPALMEDLKRYINITSDLRGLKNTLFLTRRGSANTRSRINHILSTTRYAYSEHVTPERLRACWFSYKNDGIPDEEILK
jgi:integrase